MSPADGVTLTFDQFAHREDIRALDPRIRWARLEANKLYLRGDDAGAEHRLLYFDGARLALLSGWGALRTALSGLLEVSPGGCQFMLSYGLVPPPYTLYAYVYHLNLGDRAEVDLAAGTVRFSVEFPYDASRSREDARPALETLEDKIAQALRRSLAGHERAVLMASGGKDSAGLLVGLGALGDRRTLVTTYEPGVVEAEAAGARRMAARYGLSHRTVKANAPKEIHALLSFLETAPVACADVALVPYVYTLSEIGFTEGVVLDGLMNDVYMGYVQPQREAVLCKLSLPRRNDALWARFESPDVGARVSYVAKSVQMYPAERILPGSRLSPRVTLSLLPMDTPFATYFRRMDHTIRGRGPTDFRAYVRGRTDSCGMTLKGALAALHQGLSIAFPYTDPALSAYCFHLPRAERYSERERASKLLLRKLITQKLGEQPYFNMKGSFRLDIATMYERQGDVIKAELDRAGPLFQQGARWVERLWARRKNYVHGYALFSWFLLAAWLNRRPPAQLELLRAGQSEQHGHVTQRF